MNYLRHVLALTSLTIGTLAGCASTESPSTDEENVDVADQALGETTCTTAPPSTTMSIADNNTHHNFTSPNNSYNPTDCPHQYLVECTPQGGGTFGSGVYYNGYSDVPNPLAFQADCEAYNLFYEAWEYHSGAWHDRGYNWLRGVYLGGDVRSCYWSTYSSSGPDFNADPAVTSSATKLRIAASRWKETGSKGAQGTDTYYTVGGGVFR